MKRILPALLLSLAVGLGAAAPSAFSEALLEQGKAALHAGDWTRAIQLLEQAEPSAAEPGPVTYYLALAKYQRAVQEHSPTDLAEAEQYFRCLMEPKEPLRAAALLGLGNCLLQKAGERDEDTLLAALEAYEQCLPAATDSQLRADARYNLERARLLLQQLRRAAEASTKPEQPPGNEGKPPVKPPHKPDKSQKPEREPNQPGTHKKPVGLGETAKPDAGEKALDTKEFSGGKGLLPPVPDQPDQPPLSAKDAQEHLKLATERIWRERHQHRLGLSKPPAENVRDW